MTMRPMESATGAESGLSAGLAEALDRADEAMGQITQALGHGADHAHNAEWPALPRRGWRNAIRDGMTSLGYWHWAAFMLANPEQLQEDAL